MRHSSRTALNRPPLSSPTSFLKLFILYTCTFSWLPSLSQSACIFSTNLRDQRAVVLSSSDDLMHVTVKDGNKKLKVNPQILFNMCKLYGSSIIDCTTQAWIRALSGQSMDCTTILRSKSACGSIVHESTANKHYSMHTLYVVCKPRCCVDNPWIVQLLHNPGIAQLTRAQTVDWS